MHLFICLHTLANFQNKKKTSSIKENEKLKFLAYGLKFLEKNKIEVDN